MTSAAPSTEPTEPGGTAASAISPPALVIPVIERAEFLAKVSHAIRTPLTSIIGFTQLLRDRVGEEDGPSAETGELLGVVERNAYRLEQLVSDLVLLGRLSDDDHHLAHQPFDVAELVATACLRAEPLARQAGVALRTDVSPGPPGLGERPSLLEGLRALLDNAIGCTPAGGEVRVTARPDADGWWLEVADDGPGIPADEQSQAFEPFHRGSHLADTDVPGAGLGLSIVAAVAHRHGGRLAMTSAEGVGTRVGIGVPSAS